MNHAFSRTARLTKFALASCLALSVFSSPARAADPQKVTIMVGGIPKLIYLPARLTEQLGYFKDEGLDVELKTGLFPEASAAMENV